MEFIYGRDPADYMHYKTDAPVNDTADLGTGQQEKDVEGSFSAGDIGQSVTEGSRFGNFLQTVTGAIRAGASKVELQTQMGGGGEQVGAEAYGKEARSALRELANANQVELTSVHVPTQIGNVSGLGQEGFRDEQRKMAVDEIRKAIDFASDVTQGGSIVFHTGEFQRPMADQEWSYLRDSEGKIQRDSDGNPQYQFLSYKEEPGRAMSYLVDKRTGKMLTDVRRSNIIREPKYKRADRDYDGMDVDGKPVRIRKDDLITLEGKYIDKSNVDHLFHRVAQWNENLKRFESEKLSWKEITQRKDEWNKRYPNQQLTSEEMAYRIQLETQIMQYRGSSLYHGRFYTEEEKKLAKLKEALKFYQDIESQVPKEELWKIMKEDPLMRYHSDLVTRDMKLPSQILKDQVTQAMQQLQYIHEASASADAQADALIDTLRNVLPISEYAKEQSSRSMAEAGIYAMQKTKEKSLSKDIYLSPENIFPEMGYGSHPQELYEMVINGRQEMVNLLTSPKVKDPHRRIILKKQNGVMVEEFEQVDNPFYRQGMSVSEAKAYAERHIKANLDIQHLGMWSKHFQPIYLKDQGRMENPDETNKRFDKWYMEQVKWLAEKGILGEVHMVDGFHTGGHTHIPLGQGELPVVSAVEYLKKHGFKGVFISEGFGEDAMSPGRILTKPWAALGANMFSSGYFGAVGGFGAPIRFTDVEHSYFQKKQAPYFVFGGYSPSNDWTLWSEVPLE